VLGVVSGLDSLAGFVMPPVVTGLLGLYGVAPATSIIAALVTAALVMGLIQARRMPGTPVTATAAAAE
jgi:hypothetical protein